VAPDSTVKLAPVLVPPCSSPTVPLLMSTLLFSRSTGTVTFALPSNVISWPALGTPSVFQFAAVFQLLLPAPPVQTTAERRTRGSARSRPRHRETDCRRKRDFPRFKMCRRMAIISSEERGLRDQIAGITAAGRPHYNHLCAIRSENDVKMAGDP
jgi:hypothetical protein